MKPEIQTIEQAIAHATNIAISGALEEAVAHFLKALQYFGYRADLLTNLGLTYTRLGRSDEAIHAFRNALLINPQLKEAHLNLGLTLLGQKRFEEAGQCFAQASHLYPHDPGPHEGLGLIAHQQGYLHKAQSHYKKALELDPSHDQSRLNLANCLLETCDAELGLSMLKNMVQPGCTDIFLSNYLMALQYSDKVSAEQILNETLRLRKKTNAQVREISINSTHTPSKLSTRRPRIGFVSADFKAHPVGWFIKGVMPWLSESFNVHLYANQTHHDSITVALQKQVLHWRNISGLSDAQACELIKYDQLDLLIDLSGYTAGHRLGVFEMRAAAKQATWLGYFGTTGVQNMDYILLDSEHAPYSHLKNFSEKVVYIDPIRMTFSPPSYAGTISIPPVEINDLITFGSFNNTSKINETTIDLWARCLQRIPSSRMIIKWKTLIEPTTKNKIRDMFSKYGIKPARLYFQSASAHDAMFEEYSEVDIALDTYPFTGGTTTCEALWMGVPVITMRGDRPVSRQSSAMLTTIGLNELIANTPAEFVEAAARLSENTTLLKNLRLSMRDRLLQSPLFNPEQFSKNFTSALNKIISS